MNKDDCSGCSHYITCATPCLYIGIVRDLAGRGKSLQERLAPPDISIINNLEVLPGDTAPTNIDYNTMLARSKDARDNAITITIKEIRELPNLMKKAVAAMLYAGITIDDIAVIIDKSTKTVRRICKR